jgi:hypothetical protein
VLIWALYRRTRRHDDSGAILEFTKALAIAEAIVVQVEVQLKAVVRVKLM